MAQEDTRITRYACPHWSLSEHTCLLNSGGLFLPVDEHIEVYCEGGNYQSCSHYMQQVLAGQTDDKQGEGENRRRYPRVPARFSFRLAECADKDHDLAHEDVATTVDLSAGGIRFESYRALPMGAEVIFTLNGTFASSPLEGTGRVRWCRSLENAPLYHAGLSFVDDHVGAAVVRRLGLP